MCLNHAQEHKHLLIVSTKEGKYIRLNRLISYSWNGIQVYLVSGLSINLSCLFGANIFDSALMLEP